MDLQSLPWWICIYINTCWSFVGICLYFYVFNEYDTFYQPKEVEVKSSFISTWHEEFLYIIPRSQFKLKVNSHLGTHLGSCNPLAIELQPTKVWKSGFFCKNTKWLPKIWLQIFLIRKQKLVVFLIIREVQKLGPVWPKLRVLLTIYNYWLFLLSVDYFFPNGIIWTEVMNTPDIFWIPVQHRPPNHCYKGSSSNFFWPNLMSKQSSTAYILEEAHCALFPLRLWSLPSTTNTKLI